MYKKLLFFKKNASGRNSTGRITVFTKGSVLKKRLPLTNYHFRKKNLFFIAGVDYSSIPNTKIRSLIFTSSGEVSYLPSRPLDSLFRLTQLESIDLSFSKFYRDLLSYKPWIIISRVPYMLLQQKKNESISNVAMVLLRGIQYARSFGSRCLIIKLDTRTGLSLVRLPSGIKKVFPAFSLSSAGVSGLKIFKKDLVSSKSGTHRNKGRGVVVRGVAKNPVDHPHGGRTKAIKYQRTP